VKKANVGNYLAQMAQAEKQHTNTMLMYYKYQQEFPDKMSIISDEITIKDIAHFNTWRLSQK
jgi:hypothetical protein